MPKPQPWVPQAGDVLDLTDAPEELKGASLEIPGRGEHLHLRAEPR